MDGEGGPEPELRLTKSMACPITGNSSKAPEFSIKIVARAAAVSSFFDLIIGAIAAMALPPQIAVPKETRTRTPELVANHCPRRCPAAMVMTIPLKVQGMAPLPVTHTSDRLRPKPSPTTAILSSFLLLFAVGFGHRLPQNRLNTAPVKRAAGAPKMGKEKVATRRIKKIFWG